VGGRDVELEQQRADDGQPGGGFGEFGETIDARRRSPPHHARPPSPHRDRRWLHAGGAETTGGFTGARSTRARERCGTWRE